MNTGLYYSRIFSLGQSHYLFGWVGGWMSGGFYDNYAILNSLDVVVEVGVALGNSYNFFQKGFHFYYQICLFLFSAIIL